MEWLLKIWKFLQFKKNSRISLKKDEQSEESYTKINGKNMTPTELEKTLNYFNNQFDSNDEKYKFK